MTRCCAMCGECFDDHHVKRRNIETKYAPLPFVYIGFCKQCTFYLDLYEATGESEYFRKWPEIKRSIDNESRNSKSG